MDSPDPLLAPPPPWIPASGVYLRRDEQIRVTSYNALAAVVLTIRSRLLRPQGGVSDSIDTQTPNTDRTAKTSIVRQDEGWLLDGQVVVTTAAPLVGQTFVVVEIVRGDGSVAVATRPLAAGYVTAKQPLLFPQPTIPSSLDGGGAIRSIAGTTPAAGADVLETVPTGARWEVLAFTAALTTAVAVANRVVSLRLDDGANTFYFGSDQNQQAASLGLQYQFSQGQPLQTTTNQAIVSAPLPIGLRLGAGFRIRTATTSIQPADQWGSVQYLVREWIEGA